MVYTAANWNTHEDDFTQVFFTQNRKQYWVPEEIATSKDKKGYQAMTQAERKVFGRTLVGLTLLDTVQGNIGMNKFVELIDGNQRKALLSFMAMMENSVHARSYSNIFITLMDGFEINELFQFAQENPQLQHKAQRIVEVYDRAHQSDIDMYVALCASVYLESFLFYSGFFYTLYLGGRGRMTATNDMINLIIRDEAIHGTYIGLLAQEYYAKIPENLREATDKYVDEFLKDLYDNEVKYTHEVYGELGLATDVVEFLKYNLNKAQVNLKRKEWFQDEDIQIDKVVEAGLSTDTKAHDFFSRKGNGYIAANIEDTLDDDVFNI